MYYVDKIRIQDSLFCLSLVKVHFAIAQSSMIARLALLLYKFASLLFFFFLVVVDSCEKVEGNEFQG